MIPQFLGLCDDSPIVGTVCVEKEKNITYELESVCEKSLRPESAEPEHCKHAGRTVYTIFVDCYDFRIGKLGQVWTDTACLILWIEAD